MNDTQTDLAAFATKIGVQFSDIGLLREAFTHRSYLNEHRESGLKHNERLEFLGDAVLELVVTAHLFRAFPDEPEGRMTAYRSALVNTDSLAESALVLAMGDHLLLSRGEAKDTGRARAYILANTFEAVIGAIYLDQGYDAAEAHIARTLFPKLDQIVEKRLWQDAKSRFQEEAQERVGITPSYEVIRQTGPDHDKRFEIGVFLGSDKVAEGEGCSKQDAEQAAARAALLAKGW